MRNLSTPKFPSALRGVFLLSLVGVSIHLLLSCSSHGGQPTIPQPPASGGKQPSTSSLPGGGGPGGLGGGDFGGFGGDSMSGGAAMSATGFPEFDEIIVSFDPSTPCDKSILRPTALIQSTAISRFPFRSAGLSAAETDVASSVTYDQFLGEDGVLYHRAVLTYDAPLELGINIFQVHFSNRIAEVNDPTDFYVQNAWDLCLVKRFRPPMGTGAWLRLPTPPDVIPDIEVPKADDDGDCHLDPNDPSNEIRVVPGTLVPPVLVVQPMSITQPSRHLIRVKPPISIRDVLKVKLRCYDIDGYSGPDDFEIWEPPVDSNDPPPPPPPDDGGPPPPPDFGGPFDPDPDPDGNEDPTEAENCGTASLDIVWLNDAWDN
ncbi:MAG: hypothetical protein ACREJQ_01305, partial [bacterium]